jgi:hypothetical protein
MAGVHTGASASGKPPQGKRPGTKRQPSNADTLPTRDASIKYQDPPRRQISNPTQRSATHAQDQYSKSSPVNSSRPPGPNVSRNASVLKSPASAPRPGVLRSSTSFQTRYMEMLLSLDTIPRLHNIYASFFAWILLAGFVFFPGTFTSIQDLSTNSEVQASETASTILNHVKNGESPE